MLTTMVLVFLASVLPERETVPRWPTWRGPTLNGVASAGQYPTEWSATDNVVWRLDLPGRGASTPIVWGDHIFLTYGKDGKNVLAGLDWTGKRQWEVVVGAEKAGKHKKGTGSNPSPVTDGKHVFVYFKSGDLACVDFAGKIVWQKNLQSTYGEDTLWWDLGTSPVLTQKQIVIAVMQTGPSYLVAFDKETGSESWRVDRGVPAPEEAAQSYSTPIVVNGDGGEQRIYVLGADHITGHDAADGKEIWRVGGLNPGKEKYFRSIASPVIAGDLLVAPYARGSTLTAVKLDGQGDVTKSHVAWFKDDLGADVPTPAALGNRVYVCTDKGDVACLEASTGKVIWREQLEKHRAAYSASPIVADGKIYLIREDAKCFVLRAADRFEVLATNELEGEMVVATPVFVNDRLLLRTFDHLYCIGK